MGIALLALAFIALALAAPAHAVVDRPPQCVDVPMAVVPGQARSIELRCNDADGPYPFTFEVGEAEHGTVTHRSPDRRTARYTPDPGFTGSDAFTVTITNADGETAQVEQRIEVTNEQLAPVCFPTTAYRYAAQEAYVMIPCEDPNEGDLVIGEVVGAPAHGTTSMPVGYVIYKPEAGYTGDDQVVLRATDGVRVSEPITVPIEVIAEEVPACTPVGTVPVRSARPKELSVQCRASSPYSLRVTIVDRPDHGRLDRVSDDRFRYTPDALHRGSDTATFNATNSEGEGEPITVAFDVRDGANEPPSCHFGYDPVLRAGTTADATVWCDDPDGDPLAVGVDTAPAHGTLTLGEPAAVATYEADGSYSGRDHYVLSVSDGRETTTMRRDITVVASDENTAPTCLAGRGFARNDSSAGAFVYCTDEENDPLIYTVSDPAHGTLAKSPTSYGINVLLDPADDFVGTDTVTVTASDGRATSTPVVARFDITAPSAPICEPLERKRVRTGNFVHIRAQCTDGMWPLDATPEVLPQHGTIESFSWGQYKYVPKPGYRGPDEFTLRVENQYGTVLLTQEIEMADDVNTPPLCGPFGSKTRTDTPLKVNFNCQDREHDRLAITLATTPAHGTISDWEEGSWGATYTPTPGFTGTDEYTLRVDDGHGGVISVEHEVTVFDPEVNEPPSCSGGAGWTKAGEPTTLQIWCLDAEDDPLTYTVVEQPPHGTLVAEPGKPLHYTPDEGFVGTDTATVQADDGRAVTQFEVGVYVDPVAPVCTSMAATTAGVAKALTLDCGPAPGMPADHVVEIVGQPGHGTLGPLADGVVTYTPAKGFVGSDTFTYRARRGDLKSTVATATVTVTAPPPPEVKEPEPEVKDPEPEAEVVTTDPAAPAPAQRATPAPAAEPTAPEAPEQTPAPESLAPLLTFRAKAITANGKPARVTTIRCPVACTATATPELVLVDRRRKTSRVRLPQRRLGLRAGMTGSVALALDPVQRRRIAKARTATLLVRVEIRTAGGPATVETLRIVIRRGRA